MKNLLTIIILIFALSENYAQQIVSMGSTHEYNVIDNGLEYTWAVTGGSTSDLSVQKESRVEIDWDTPGDYVLSVFGTDSNLCISETQIIDVHVLGKASIIFAHTSANIITCSNLNSGAAGGPLDTSEFELTINSGLAPYVLRYKILKPDGTDYSPEREISNLSGKGDILSIDNDFKNNTLSDVVYSVLITELITADGYSIPLSTDKTTITRTITIHAKPVISTIKIN